jgi:hypothetical protein
MKSFTRWRTLFTGVFFAFLMLLSGQTIGQFVTVGTPSGVNNTTTTYPAPFGNFWWGSRQQFLYPASDLAAAGLAAGDITAIQFNIISTNGVAHLDYTIQIGQTSATSLTAWETGLTTVYGPVSQTPAVGLNTFNFAAPFNWDGVSNIVIEICHQNTSFTQNSVAEWTVVQPYNASRTFRADAAGVCANTGVTAGQNETRRPMTNFEGVLASCLPVENVDAINITETTADITFTGASGDIYVEYGVAPFTPGTDATAGGGTVVGPFAGSPVAISGLSASSDYVAYVRQECTPGDWSGNVAVSFSTTCGVYSTPYFEGFEGLGETTNATWPITSCIVATPNSTGSLLRWDRDANTTISGSTGPNGPFEGGLYAFLETSSGAAGATATLDLGPIDASTLTVPALSFWYHMFGATTGTLRVLISTDGINFTEEWSLTGQQQLSGADPWAEVLLPLPAYAGQTLTVRFEGTRGTSFTGDIAIDAIGLNEAPSCFPPVSISAGSVDDVSAQISWDCPGCTGQFYVEYGAPGFTAGTDATAGTGTVEGPFAAGPVTISGLTSATNYEFTVRQDCGVDGFSNNFLPFGSFTTTCSVEAAPYANGFETFTPATNATWPPSECFQANPTNTTGAFRWNQQTGLTPSNFSTGPSGAHEGSVYAFTEGSSGVLGSVATLDMPLVDLTGLTDPMLFFFYHMWASAPADMGTLNVLVSTDGINYNNEFTLTGGQQALKADPYEEAFVSLAAYAGQVIYIRFEAVRGSSFNCDIAIDALAIDEAPACAKPIGATASNVLGTTADISWTCVGCTGSFYIEYGAPGFTPGTDANPGTGTVEGPFVGSPQTISGLTTGTDYQFVVRQDCGIDGFSENSTAGSFSTPPGCGDTFADNGGVAGVYAPNSNDIFTICPDNPPALVEVTFTSFQTELNWDGLFVFDGPDTNSPLIPGTNAGNSTGSGSIAAFVTQYGGVPFWGTLDPAPGPFLSSHPSGCLTFQFVSDGSVQQDGFEATINCIDCGCPAPGITLVSYNDTEIVVDVVDNSPCFAVEDYLSFDLTWSFGGSATGVSMPFTITGLTPGTLYSVDAVANCAGPEVSDPNGIFVTTLNCSENDVCTYDLTLTNTTGTGFDGALVRIDNGWSTTDYTLGEDDATGTFQIFACPGNPIQVELINDVALANNYQISLVNSSLVEVYGVSGPAPGVLYFQADGCPDCNPVNSIQVGRLAADLVEVSWNNIELLANVTDITVNVTYFDFFTFEDVVIGTVTVPAGTTSASVPLDASYPFEFVTIEIVTNCTNGGAAPNNTSAALPACDAADQCEYFFDMTSLEDGWQGNQLNVSIDGGTPIAVSLATGTSGSQSVFACAFGTIDITAELNTVGSAPGCINAAAFGSLAISSATTTPTTITTCNFATEFANLTVNTAGTYQFTSSIATDYLTLTDGANNIINAGPTPLDVSIPATGAYRLHVNTDANCGTNTTCRATTAQYLGAGGAACDAFGFEMVLNPSTDNATLIPAGDFCPYEDGDLIYSAETCPSCFQPVAVNADNITNEAVDITWTSSNAAGTSATVYIGAPGFDPLVDPLFSQNIILAATGAQGPVNFTGLSGFTQYEVIVIEDCNGDPADASAPIAFTTLIDNDICALATPLTVQASIDCPTNETVGTTEGATDTGGPFSCISPPPLVDVYYTFNSGALPGVQLNISLGTQSTIAVEVYDACGGNVVFCGDGLPVDPIQFATDPNTDYFIRIATLTTTTGTHNICVSQIAGCTDSSAPNFNPLASEDDGTCIVCQAGETGISVDMIDTFGDGWNGATYTISDNNDPLNPVVLFTGDLDNADLGDGSSVGTDFYCLLDGCYLFTVTGGTFPGEVQWTLNGVDFGPESGGAPASIQFSINGGCTIFGCTNPAAINFDPAATDDDLSCILPDCPDAPGNWNYCYGDNENNEFYFEPIAPGTQVALFFNSGDIQGSFSDQFVIYDGADNTAPILFGNLTSNTDLTGLLVQSTLGNGLFVTLVSNAFTSCETSTLFDPIDADIFCGTLEIPGCQDPAAANFDPDATFDDGSCIIPDCIDPPFVFTYCYGNNENSTFFISPNTPGENIVIVFEQGTVESTTFDNLTLYDGADATAPVIYTNPGTTTQLDGFVFESTNGNGIFVTLTTDPSVSCQSTASYNDIIANVFCGSIVIPGCTDPLAPNFNPSATLDDGSCISCDPGETSVELDMTDTFGDGWNGATYSITSFVDPFNPTVIATGSLNTALIGDGSSTGQDYFCLLDGCYELTITGGTFPGEVQWTLNGADGGPINGGAPTTIGFTINTPVCPVLGCTDPAAVNWDPAANTDDGTCVFPPANDDCVDAVSLTPVQWPSTQNVLGTLTGASANGSTACAGTNGPDVFYTFNVAKENHFWVNLNPFSGFAGVVEVLDACDGTVIACESPSAVPGPFCNQPQGGAGFASDPACEAAVCALDAFCCNNTWDGICASTAAGQTACAGCLAPEVDEPISIFIQNLAPGDYIVRIREFNGASFLTPAQFLVNVQFFPTAKVQDNPNNLLYACNQSGFQLEDIIGATPQSGAGALDYEWMMAPQGGTTQFIWQRGQPNYSTTLNWLQAEYGVLYNVYVRILLDIPGEGLVWGVFQVDGTDPNAPGAEECTVEMAAQVAGTQLRPNYSPTNAQGNFYALCDIALAFNVYQAEDFHWRFDPDTDPTNGNEIFYFRGSGNPGVRLSNVGGLVPGNTYNVAVEVQVQGVWSGFSTTLPITLALPPNDVEVRSQFCDITLPSASGIILAESVCSSDFYEWEFDGPTLSTATTPSYAVNLGAAAVQPPLQPGVYSVRVKVTQEGVPGDFGPTCTITIGGPGMDSEGTPAMRIAGTGDATLFPNPNAGEEVRVELNGLSDGNHDVRVNVYDIYGKLLTIDQFGHEGTNLSRVVRFEQDLATGMYMVHILVDGEQFAVERLVVK